MLTYRVLCPLRQASSTLHHAQSIASRQHRTFLSSTLFAPETQTLSAHRTLPYPQAELFALIADINSYPTFLPYCVGANVTSTLPVRQQEPTSPPHNDSSATTTLSKIPLTATLTVGFQSLTETFPSRLYSIPGSVLEAVAGEARTTIPKAQIQSWSDDSKAWADDVPQNEIFERLLTRWSLKEQGPGRTGVGLHIEFAFRSPIYAALAKGAAPRVAGMMVEAFEKRAGEVLGRGKR